MSKKTKKVNAPQEKKPPTINDVLQVFSENLKEIAKQVDAQGKAIKDLNSGLNFLSQRMEQKPNPNGKTSMLNNPIVGQIFEAVTKYLSTPEPDQGFISKDNPKFQDLQDAWFDSLISETKNRGSISDKTLALRDVDLQIRTEELNQLKKRSESQRPRFGIGRT